MCIRDKRTFITKRFIYIYIYTVILHSSVGNRLECILTERNSPERFAGSERENGFHGEAITRGLSR